MTRVITDIESSLHGFIASERIGNLPVGLLAQLVERCTHVTEVTGSNQVEAWNFPFKGRGSKWGDDFLRLTVNILEILRLTVNSKW